MFGITVMMILSSLSNLPNRSWFKAMCKSISNFPELLQPIKHSSLFPCCKHLIYWVLFFIPIYCTCLPQKYFNWYVTEMPYPHCRALLLKIFSWRTPNQSKQTFFLYVGCEKNTSSYVKRKANIRSKNASFWNISQS